MLCLDNSENGLLNKCWLVFYILNVASNTVKNHCSALSVQSLLALLQRLSVNQMSLLPKKISHTSEDRVDFHHTIWTLFQHLLPRQNREIFCDWKNANENLSKWTLLAIFMRLSTFFWLYSSVIKPLHICLLWTHYHFTFLFLSHNLHYYLIQ